MGTRYTVVTWPESQDLVQSETNLLINDDEGLDIYGPSAFLVANKDGEVTLTEEPLEGLAPLYDTWVIEFAPVQ